MTRYFKLKNENFDTDDFDNCSSVTNEVFSIVDEMVDIIIESTNAEVFGTAKPVIMALDDEGETINGVEFVSLRAADGECWTWALADVIEIDEQGEPV